MNWENAPITPFVETLARLAIDHARRIVPGEFLIRDRGRPVLVRKISSIRPLRLPCAWVEPKNKPKT